MNMKRIIALVIAVLMLVCMFSACGAKDDAKTDDKGSSSSSDTKKEDKKEDKKDDKKDDAPAEDDKLFDVKWLGQGELDSTRWPITLQGAIDGEYAITNEFFRVAKEIYHVNYTFDVVPNEIYVNTLNSLAATNELPNTFLTRSTQGFGTLDDVTIVDWIEQGMLLSCSEAIKYSTGNFQKFFGEEDGCMRWAYAWAQYVDGDWYCVTQGNDTPYMINVTESDGPLRLPVQVANGIYTIMYRQNWLDDFGYAMPTNPDEFYDASLAIHDGDANGNGLTDERVMLCLGSTYQYCGVGAWYGLPMQDFIEDPSTMKIEVACLCDGFADWATYMNKLYNANIIQVGDGSHIWGFGAALAENNVTAWWCNSESVRASGVNSCDCDYEPLPIIVVGDYKHRVVIQEAAAASFTFSASSATDPEGFARWVDFIYSEELFMLDYYGIEGESYQWNDDGTITSWGGNTITDNSKTVEDEYKALLKGVDWISIGPLGHNQDCYPINGGIYDSVEEALKDEAVYKELSHTRDSWMAAYNWYTDHPAIINQQRIVDYGEKDIDWAAYYTLLCLPTQDEGKILQDYGTDLKTYVLEIGTKLVTGDYTVDMIDDLVSSAMDTYHLQDYLDVLNETAARFVAALNA